MDFEEAIKLDEVEIIGGCLSGKKARLVEDRGDIIEIALVKNYNFPVQWVKKKTDAIHS